MSVVWCIYRRLPSQNNMTLILLMGLATAALLLFLYSPNMHEKHHTHKNDYEDEIAPEHSLQTLSHFLTQVEKCPICFGQSFCDEIQKGFLMLEHGAARPETAGKGVFFGRWAAHRSSWGGTRVVVKSYSAKSNRFHRLDQYLCDTMLGKKNGTCDVALAAENERSKVKDILSPANVKHAYKITGTQPSDLMYTVCSNEQLLSSLSQQFDIDLDGNLSPTEMANFVTSLLIQPEPGLLPFLSAQEIFLVPNFLGACGRVIVIEDGGTPLGNFLYADWRVRANLALQVLDAIERFAEINSQWAILFTDFSFENFAVRQEHDKYHLVVIDLEDIIIVDKDATFDEEIEKGLSQVCNEDCFDDYWKSLMDINNANQPSQCQRAGTYGVHMMYSQACKHLLANSDRNIGLLHSPPQDVVKELKLTLQQCIVENAPQERLKAVKNLFSILLPYAYKSDEDYDNESH